MTGTIAYTRNKKTPSASRDSENLQSQYISHVTVMSTSEEKRTRKRCKVTEEAMPG
jgi:hypothetical protein